MSQERLELKVGVFVILSLVVLTVLVFKVGDYKTEPGYTVKLLFPSVRGVESGASVRLAGIIVGNVRGVRVVRGAEGRTQAELTAWIKRSASIESDAQVRISSLSVLGDKFVEILPGISPELLTEGSVLVGQTPPVLEDVTESSRQLITQVEDAVNNINELMGDTKFKDSVRNTFRQADTFTANLKETSDNLKEASASAKIVLGRLRDGEGTVGRLLKDDKIAKDMEAFVADIKAHPWKLLKRS